MATKYFSDSDYLKNVQFITILKPNRRAVNLEPLGGLPAQPWYRPNNLHLLQKTHL